MWSAVCGPWGVVPARYLRLDAEDDKEKRDEVNPLKGDVQCSSAPSVVAVKELEVESFPALDFTGVERSWVDVFVFVYRAVLLLAFDWDTENDRPGPSCCLNLPLS